MIPPWATAIGESNSSQSEWEQFYRRDIPCQPTGGGGGSGDGGIVFGRASPMAESTVVTTTTILASSPGRAGGDRVQQVCEGRMGKVARRRSRASRKTPTTVLNTDTTNFRAMVQQFTGVPSTPFQAGYSHMADGGTEGGPATLSFGVTGRAAQHHQQPAVFPFGVQQQHSQFQQHQERPLFTLGGIGGSDIYLRGFGANPHRDSMDASEGLLLESIPSTQMISRPAASTGSSTTNGFLFDNYRDRNNKE